MEQERGEIKVKILLYCDIVLSRTSDWVISAFIISPSPPPEVVQNFAINVSVSLCLSFCLSVCLSYHISQKPHQFLYSVRCLYTLQNWWNLDVRTCYLWPWLGPLLTGTQYVVYFRFYGCRNVFTLWSERAGIRDDARVSSCSPAGGSGGEVCRLRLHPVTQLVRRASF